MKARSRELTGILVQFLNKCDLLQKKLARGVRVYDYVPSFGDRPNDAPTTAKCAFAVSPPASLIHSADTCLVRLDALPDFRQQFRDYLLRYSPQQRGFYSYLTSVAQTHTIEHIFSTYIDSLMERNANTRIVWIHPIILYHTTATHKVAFQPTFVYSC